MLKKCSPLSTSLFLLATALAACTSTGPVDKISSRAVDRAYTLPKGVASWKTLAVTGNVKTPSENLFLPPIPIPLFWEQSLNDNLTLEWLPLPLSLRYQISRTENQVWGARFGIGFGFSSGDGTVFSPSLGLYNRSKLNADVALETSLAGQVTVGSDIDTGYAVTATTGPMFQVSDTAALKASLGVSVSKSGLGDAGVAVETTGKNSVLIPLGFGLDWRMAQQWNLAANYSFLGIGSADWSANLVLLDLTHYW